MKKALLLISYSLTVIFTLNAQSATLKIPSAAAVPKDDVLQLKETGYSFGKIPQGRPVIHVFEIVNTGKEPLLLENVQASCGCTNPNGAGPPSPWAPQLPLKWDIMLMLMVILTKQLPSFTTTGKRKR